MWDKAQKILIDTPIPNWVVLSVIIGVLVLLYIFNPKFIQRLFPKGSNKRKTVGRFLIVLAIFEIPIFDLLLKWSIGISFLEAVKEMSFSYIYVLYQMSFTLPNIIIMIVLFLVGWNLQKR